jgi:hypothetical protein
MDELTPDFKTIADFRKNVDCFRVCGYNGHRRYEDGIKPVRLFVLYRDVER